MTTQSPSTNASELSLRPFGRPSLLWWLTVAALSVVVAGVAA